MAEPRELKYFTGERIYLRKIVGKTLFCAYVKEKNIADQSVYISKLNNTDFLTKYVIAILNSRLLAWYFRICNNEFDDLFPQIKVAEFKELPIKKLDKELQKKIVKVVDYLIQIKKNENETMSFYFEQLIDGMVYELYFENEIKQAGCDILKYLDDLPEIKDEMSDDEKLKIITKVFNKLYDKESPVRKNLEAMEDVEEVKIIKESLEK
ncbi:MAG: adenine-specific DNA-methyltransferase [Anaerophaga sp.]|nr:adenine-specific DNA-methyltransferase [Anaerophaga sp.]